jgi:hypothetical protein
MNKPARMVLGSLAALTALLAVGASTPAHAGAKYTNTVYINTSSRSVTGSMGSTRNSSDVTQYIGCALEGFASYTSVYVDCYARDYQGVYVTCESYAPSLVTAVSNMSSDSFIRFDYNQYGECTLIRTLDMSYTAPKQP